MSARLRCQKLLDKNHFIYLSVFFKVFNFVTEYFFENYLNYFPYKS